MEEFAQKLRLVDPETAREIFDLIDENERLVAFEAHIEDLCGRVGVSYFPEVQDEAEAVFDRFSHVALSLDAKAGLVLCDDDYVEKWDEWFQDTTEKAERWRDVRAALERSGAMESGSSDEFALTLIELLTAT
jgi:hypothetical protein